jgi:hypothetical protein
MSSLKLILSRKADRDSSTLLRIIGSLHDSLHDSL